MKTALVTSHGRMASCFAGVEVRIVSGDEDLDSAETTVTDSWHPLTWGKELMRHDVNTLLCAGIDLQTWAGIQGYGIEVIPEAIGDPAQVLEAWRNHQLEPPRAWPFHNPPGCSNRRCGTGRRKRCRRGRQEPDNKK